jgi:hypothetical protein
MNRKVIVFMTLSYLKALGFDGTTLFCDWKKTILREQSTGERKLIHFVTTENESERLKLAIHRCDPTLCFMIETVSSQLFIPENLKPSACPMRSETPFGNRRDKSPRRLDEKRIPHRMKVLIAVPIVWSERLSYGISCINSPE